MAQRFSTAQFSPLKSQKDSVKQPPRVKAFHHKARTGCPKCKQRRVKCDETKPSCQRCLKAGFLCEGYSKPQALVFGLQGDTCFSSDFEKMCFDSFIEHGGLELSAFQPSSRPLWATLAPQLSQVYTAVRHALIALSVIQEPIRRIDFRSAALESGTDTYSLSLIHYNRAIQAFTLSGKSLPLTATLTCCSLFTGLSVFLEKACGSIVHTKAIREMIDSYQKKVGGGKEVREPTIEKVFDPTNRRLLLDCSTFMDECETDIYGLVDETYSELLYVPDSFPNENEAYECLSIILQHIISLENYPVEVRSLVREKLSFALPKFIHTAQTSLLTWNSVTDFKNNSRLKITLMSFLLHHRVASLMLEASSTIGSTCYDLFDTDFDFILDSCCNILDLETCGKAKPRQHWGLTFGIIPPLFFVATCCRNKSIRSRALDALHTSSRIERGLSSCMAFALARMVVDKEEKQRIVLAGEDLIPIHARVRLYHAEFSHTDSKINIQYMTEGGNEEIFTEVLPYKAHPILAKSKCSVPLSKKSLRASAYTGAVLNTPTISCHCASMD